MLQILGLTRFLPQISLRNLRKLDCYANRYPLRSKTLYPLRLALRSEDLRSPVTAFSAARLISDA
jgi:hypothetical protein